MALCLWVCMCVCVCVGGSIVFRNTPPPPPPPPLPSLAMTILNLPISANVMWMCFASPTDFIKMKLSFLSPFNLMLQFCHHQISHRFKVKMSLKQVSLVYFYIIVFVCQNQDSTLHNIHFISFLSVISVCTVHANLKKNFMWHIASFVIVAFLIVLYAHYRFPALIWIIPFSNFVKC